MTEVTIRYEVERIDAGEWLIWRHTEDGKITAVGFPGSRVKAMTFRTKSEADDAIPAQMRVDLAAASRLGVRVVHICDATLKKKIGFCS